MEEDLTLDTQVPHIFELFSSSDSSTQAENFSYPHSLPTHVHALVDRVLDLPIPASNVETPEYWLGAEGEACAEQVVRALELMAGKLAHLGKGVTQAMQHLTKKSEKAEISTHGSIVLLTERLKLITERLDEMKTAEIGIREAIDTLANITEKAKKTYETVKMLQVDDAMLQKEKLAVQRARMNRKREVKRLESIFMERAEVQNKTSNIREVIRILTLPSHQREYHMLHRLVSADSFLLSFGKVTQSKQLEAIQALNYYHVKNLQYREDLAGIEVALHGVHERITRVVACSWGYHVSTGYNSVLKAEAQQAFQPKLVMRLDQQDTVDTVEHDDVKTMEQQQQQQQQHQEGEVNSPLLDRSLGPDEQLVQLGISASDPAEEQARLELESRRNARRSKIVHLMSELAVDMVSVTPPVTTPRVLTIVVPEEEEEQGETIQPQDHVQIPSS